MNQMYCNKTLLVWLGFKRGAAGWKAQTNRLDYGEDDFVWRTASQSDFFLFLPIFDILKQKYVCHRLTKYDFKET